MQKRVKLEKKGCVFGHIDKFWEGRDGQIKKNACKKAYLGYIFIPEKYVIRVLFVCSWTSLIPPLAIRVAPPGSHNKSPGLDGLPTEFYIVFFHNIADLLVASLNFSFEQGILSPSQRNGVVTLLPKKDRHPNFVKNYRPISLLTSAYKFIAKTMANRLTLVLDDLIHEDQNGFMKGRNISL